MTQAFPPENNDLFHSSAIQKAEDSGSLTEHILQGDVEKVIYESSDGTFAIMYLRDLQGERHCICGPLGGLHEGQSLSVKGKWETHKEYGRRLKVTHFESTLPSTPEGIEKYLSSGIIKGVGEKYAKLIVEHFGKETLHILDNASVRLKEIPGLGKKRISAIKKAWDENKDRRSLQIYMQSLGISPAYFAKIYALYGDRSAEILRTDPYQLASQVDGIGFILADRIAEKAGIGKNDPKRLVAGVKYTLEQIRIMGHICMPSGEFLKTVSALLKVEEEDAAKALHLAAECGRAAFDHNRENDEVVYDPAMLRCEQELPRLLVSLLSFPRFHGERMRPVPPLPGSRFSDEQLAAVKEAAFSPVSIITGGPGVGKTTVVAEIVRRANLAKLRTALAAPTGRAAKRMSETTNMTAYTLHRLLKWNGAERKFVHGKTNPLPFDLFILDETSMLDLPLATAFFRAVPPGASVVLVGDCDQLPSVGPGNILNDLISSGTVPVTRLTKIFRQGEGSNIIVSAHEVNSGRIPECIAKNQSPAQKSLTDFYWIAKEEPEDAFDVIMRLVAERIPERFSFDPLNDIQVLSPMNKGICGTLSLNTALQERLNKNTLAFRQGERIFRLGDKVMQTANDYDKGVFNGDTGRITAIRHDEKTFTVAFDSVNVNYSFQEAEALTLAYAVTVHKSQGSEFPVVVMPVLTSHFVMLQRNLLYTGMTRAKKLMILVGSPKALSMAVRNAVREPRFTLLEERLCSEMRKMIP
ncbi:MAG: ATP-dependent RecD-like DNA helicase [Lentisphaeria bacterium]|nr:ATP-dependent RecD-like DNA helicase [Lentisphaeria bacterium]